MLSTKMAPGFCNTPSWKVRNESFDSLAAVNEVLNEFPIDMDKDIEWRELMELDDQLHDLLFENKPTSFPPQVEPMEIERKKQEVGAMPGSPSAATDFPSINTQYRHASEMLAMSMKRTSETRQSLSLSLGDFSLPPSEMRERQTSLTYVLTSVEQSTRQIQASLFSSIDNSSEQSKPDVLQI